MLPKLEQPAEIYWMSWNPPDRTWLKSDRQTRARRSSLAAGEAGVGWLWPSLEPRPQRPRLPAQLHGTRTSSWLISETWTLDSHGVDHFILWEREC